MPPDEAPSSWAAAEDAAVNQRLLAVDGAGADGAAPRKDRVPVTHVAVEGRDVELRREWDDAAVRVALALGRKPASVVEVSPEAWRKELLLPKERRSGQQAKAAARQVARQVVSDLSATAKEHAGSFPTDTAEAVCAGYHVARTLGWEAASEREPAVARYQNGAIRK